MKSNEIKDAIENIQIDENSKIRIFNNIQIESNKNRRGVFMMKMKYKYVGSIVTGLMVICAVVYMNNDLNTIGNKGTSSVSEQVVEKLAIVGTIEEILPKEDDTADDKDIVAKVSGELKDGSVYEDILVHIHASTNVLDKSENNLLEISDLKVGQKVKVYYDGTENELIPGEISGLRVVILDK